MDFLNETLKLDNKVEMFPGIFSKHSVSVSETLSDVHLDFDELHPLNVTQVIYYFDSR